MHTDRTFLLTAGVLAIVTIALHILGAQPAYVWMWGVHCYAFFPGPLLFVASGLALVLVMAFVVGGTRVGAGLARALRGRRVIALAVVLVVAAPFIFWTARTRHTYLGDGNVIIAGPHESLELHERQPLATALNYTVYRTVRGWFTGESRSTEDVAQDAFAVASVLAGLLFVLLAWFLARELGRLRRDGDGDDGGADATVLLVWLVLCAQGYMQLFFGYVENYAFYTAGLALYMWLALRHLRGAPLLWPGLALILCVALHLSAVVLAPSFVVLAVHALRARARRSAALRDLAIVAAALVALHVVLAMAKEGYSLLATLVDVTRLAATRRQEGVEGYMFSGQHLRDFSNEQLLIGPLGLMLFAAALVTVLVARTWRNAAVVVLAVAGLGYALASWLAGDSNLGYARNWDLLAPAGLVFTVAALGLYLARAGKATALVPALSCALVLSLYHTVPWIATNADGARGLARLKTLPLGLGRTEVVVSQWYRRHGQHDEELAWLSKAVSEHPYNNNAQSLLGLYYYERDQYDLAAAAFTKAAALRPDKVEFRYYLAQSLVQSNRLPEAIPHLEFLLARDPEHINNWILYAEALKQAGRTEDAYAAFVKMEPLYRRLVDANPDGYAPNLGYGWILYNARRYADALPYLEKALYFNPRSDPALCNLGHVLRALGRDGEAVARYEECLAINPEHPDRGEIEEWLATIE